MAIARDEQSEWLETDGLGGFASGTVSGIRTRRYHGLLLSAASPPTERAMLVNGVEVFITTSSGRFALSSQRYDGQVVYPEGFRFIESFASEPWPTWRFALPDGTVIEHEILIRHGAPLIVLSWRQLAGDPGATLEVRPLISGRDYHALHHENSSLRFAATDSNGRITWQPYDGLPAIQACSNGDYHHDAVWYRNFFYQEEWLRGFPEVEDLASPGRFQWMLDRTTSASLLLSAGPNPLDYGPDATAAADAIRTAESARRASFKSSLHRAADQYIVRRGTGKTIIAGYPWFGDWGRDSFVSLRGLCLATSRFDEAGEILASWASYVSDGMLPNRFPDAGEQPEYNSVDAALWYVIAAEEFLLAAKQKGVHVPTSQRSALNAAVDAILTGYSRGTRFGIHADRDGLLAAGERGVQLTWMDARVNGRCITPRTGKPVEVEALWLNALWLAGAAKTKWQELFATGYASFRERFWNPASETLYDVIDWDHRPGAVDPSFRPNQIFAVGGLPLVLIEPGRARQVVEQIERHLWTPVGLRSLAPGEPQYTAQYTGGPEQRDAAYHQGTVWPWLIGPFVEAWIRVHGNDMATRTKAKSRFVDPLLRHLTVAGLGHISEIADAEPPHMPRGCPFQAWSIAELLRIHELLAASPTLSVHQAKPRPARSPVTIPEPVGHPICG